MAILIIGAPGTGKSYLIKRFRKLYPHMVASSTTWVSGLLIDAPTFYRQLRIPKNFENLKPRYNNYKTYIIDEASMLSRDTFIKLKNFLPNANFILVGDWDQLKPVNGDMITEADVDYVIKLAPHANQRVKDPGLSDLLFRLKNKNLMKLDDNMIEGRQKDVNDLNKTDLILCYTNQRRKELLSKFETHYAVGQRLIGYKVKNLNLIEKDDKEHILPEESKVEIFAPKNAWWLNNEIVTIEESTRERVKVRRSNGEAEFISGKDFRFFESAHCLSIHKAQGQTIKGNFTIDLDDISKCKDIEERTKLIYVALSRAERLDQITFIGKLPLTCVLVEKFKNLDVYDNNENVAALPLMKIINEFNSNKRYQEVVYIVYRQGPGTFNKDQHYSSRQMGKLCGVAHNKILKWRKRGLSDEEILKKYGKLPEDSIKKDTSDDDAKEKRQLKAKFNETKQEFSDIDDKRWDYTVDDPRNKFYNTRSKQFFDNQLKEAYNNLKNAEALVKYYEKLKESSKDTK